MSHVGMNARPLARPERAFVRRSSTTGDVQGLQEWEVVRRAQRLDPAALSSLYEVYFPRVYGYAYLQLGDVQLAEDVASDVMLKLLESLKSLRFRGVPFRAWVFRVAHNRVIDVHRRRRRRPEVGLHDEIVAAQEDPAAAMDRSLDRRRLQAALLRLTEEQRQVIILKFIEGFDNASAARVLGRSQGAVKSLQHRALVSLRHMLSEASAGSGRQPCYRG
ncbi:MAG TPA: sigma-70 family RNA polymerase sigma factor [Longimicrobiales bacterium]|nr:sigma-70 family RNA polymerase sigma factor [Longimicrobiales bacterium]